LEVNQFIGVTKDLMRGQEVKAFQQLLPLFGTSNAIEIIKSCCELDDARILNIVTEACGDAQKAQQTLLHVWERERVARAIQHTWIDRFYITLKGDEDRIYQIEVSVTLSDTGANVLFHHVTTNLQYPTPEACIDWGSLDPLDEAMWVLLVSKIEGLPNAWFVEAARANRNSLLVPLSLDNIESDNQ
jgi:hypothetical protein